MYDGREERLVAQNAKIAAEYDISGIPAPPQGARERSIYNGAKDCCEAQQLYRPSTFREQAEKQVGYHRDQADKHDRAVAFLRDNPAFDEFVRLVREGVIHF